MALLVHKDDRDAFGAAQSFQAAALRMALSDLPGVMSIPTRARSRERLACILRATRSVCTNRSTFRMVGRQPDRYGRLGVPHHRGVKT